MRWCVWKKQEGIPIHLPERGHMGVELVVFEVKVG